MKFRILILALLAIFGLPALASAETTQVAVNVPADLLDHVLDALISGGLVAIAWAVSHWRIIKRIGSIGEGVGTLLSRLEGTPLPTVEAVKKEAFEGPRELSRRWIWKPQSSCFSTGFLNGQDRRPPQLLRPRLRSRFPLLPRLWSPLLPFRRNRPLQLLRNLCPS